MRAVVALCLVLLGATCSDPNDNVDAGPSQDQPGSLVDHEAWVELDAASDPFAAHRPDDVNCPAWSRQIEGTIFEIETDDCNYASLSQPSQRPLKAGERVDVIYWHLWLWAAEEAQAHVALQIGDWLVFENHVAIPGPEGHYQPSQEVPYDLPAGTPIVFHLHNHGVNSWRLLSIDRVQP